MPSDGPPDATRRKFLGIAAGGLATALSGCSSDNLSPEHTASIPENEFVESVSINVVRAFLNTPIEVLELEFKNPPTDAPGQMALLSPADEQMNAWRLLTGETRMVLEDIPARLEPGIWTLIFTANAELSCEGDYCDLSGGEVLGRVPVEVTPTNE